ncbi:MAG: hypothetical protein ABIO17_08890, partial [Pseudoxanthomonas sp.]
PPTGAGMQGDGVQDERAQAERMQTICWNYFQKVELRVGRIIAASAFPQARMPVLCVPDREVPLAARLL